MTKTVASLLTNEQVLGALAVLGEDASAERLAAVKLALDMQLAPEKMGVNDIYKAIDTARRAVDSQLDAGKLDPAWTSEYEDAAAREGWLISDCGWSDGERWRIQRIDTPADFADEDGLVPPALGSDDEGRVMAANGVGVHHVAARAFLKAHSPREYIAVMNFFRLRDNDASGPAWVLQHQLSSDDVLATLRQHALQVSNTNGESFDSMAERIFDDLDLPRLERAAFAAGGHVAAQSVAVRDSIADQLVESGVLKRKDRGYRYLEGSWSHIFDEDEGTVQCRLVFDVLTNTVVALQKQDDLGHWVFAGREDAADVQDSLVNANAEALLDPSKWAHTNSVPRWASSDRPGHPASATLVISVPAEMPQFAERQSFGPDMRVMRLQQAVRAWRVADDSQLHAPGSGPDKAAIVSMLADIRHYCDAGGLEFGKLDRLAHADYSEQRAFARDEGPSL